MDGTAAHRIVIARREICYHLRQLGWEVARHGATRAVSQKLSTFRANQERKTRSGSTGFMALSGNTRELSLADLIVVKAQDPRNHRLSLSGPAGDGLLLIESGRIVHAAYGNLPPLDAAHALVTEQNVDFEIEADAEIPGHTLDLGAQELLMEAMRRLDEGELRRPKQIVIDMGSSGSLREPPRPRSYEARKSPEAEALRRAMGRVLFADQAVEDSDGEGAASRLWIVLLAIALFVAATTFAWRRGWLSGEEHRDPVEVTDLSGPRDVLPMLASGAPPLAPEGDTTFLPTILCRALIDTQGRVYEARVYQPRDGFDAFERAAVAAVRDYRFTPAMREGVAVPVWITWPVDFVRARLPSDAPPPPVDARFFKSERDRLPELLEGEPPVSPVPDRGAKPSIQLRLLIDTSGSVAESHVVDPRSDLELYERLALDAVEAFRFSPAEREGVLVPAWIPWTIEFQ